MNSGSNIVSSLYLINTINWASYYLAEKSKVDADIMEDIARLQEHLSKVGN